MTLSARSGAPPNKSDETSLVAKQASDYLNAHSAMYAGLSNFFTLFIFFITEFFAYNASGKDTFSDKNQQDTVNNEIKFYGGFWGIVFSFVASIIWLVHWRKHHQDKLAADPSYDIAAELDKIKNRSNPWARRFLTGSIPGNFIGQTLGDGLGYFLPTPFSKVLRGVFSAIGGVITGTIALLAIGDGEDMRETASMRAEDRDGKDGWTRSLKIGSLLGSTAGAAVGAILGLIILGPLGALLGSGLGAAMGGGIGFGVYHMLNRSAKPKDVIMAHDDIVTDQQIINYLPKVLCKETHANKLYLLRVVDRGDKDTKPYKMVLYRSLTPSGRTKTAILKVGLSEGCDIQHDPEKPFDLHHLDNKVKEKILKIASKRAHIPPLCAADSKDRTKYRRMGIGLGSALGGLLGAGIGFGLSFAFPIFAVILTSGLTLGIFLFGLVGAAALAFGGYYLMKHLGPKISAWVNPDDYTSNSYDYGMVTGQSTVKTVASSTISLVHQFSKLGKDADDIIANAGSLLGAGIGAGYDIHEGRKQQASLLERLSQNNLPNNHPDKELADAEIEYQFAAEFKANKKITAWSQSAGEFARYGAPLLIGIGFFIGNLLFPGIGGLVGAAIGGIAGAGGGFVVGFFWGDKIYGYLLGDSVRSLLKNNETDNTLVPALKQAVNDNAPLLAPAEQVILENYSSTDLPSDAVAPEASASVVALLPRLISRSIGQFKSYEVSPTPGRSFNSDDKDHTQASLPNLPLETSSTYSAQPHGAQSIPTPPLTTSRSPESPLSPIILGKAIRDPLGLSTPGKLSEHLKKDERINSAPTPKKPMPVSAPINIVSKNYNKHKEKHKTKLGRLPFLSSQKDTSPVTHDSGLGEEELSRRTQISQLAKHVVRGKEKQAKKILIEHPQYALEALSVSIRDLSGCWYKGYSPLQLAYMVGDVAMCQMILSSLSCLRSHQRKQGVKHGKQSPYQKNLSQPYREVMQHALQQIQAVQNKVKPNDLSYDLNQLAEVIKKDTLINNDMQIMMASSESEFPINEETDQALEKFKAEFAANNILPEQRLAIIKLLGDASRIYAKYYSQWSQDQSSLYWGNVIGYLQRLLPANYLQAVCDGLLQLVHNNFKLQVTRYSIAEITNALGTKVAILSRKDALSLTDLSDGNLFAVYPRFSKMAHFIEEDLTLIEKFHANNEEQMKQFVKQFESIIQLSAALPNLVEINLSKKTQDDAICLYSKYKAKPEPEPENKENSGQQANQFKRKMSYHFFHQPKKLGVRAAAEQQLAPGAH